MPSKQLSVPYFAQNDNERWYSDGAAGNTQCNATSHAMLLAYLLPDFSKRSKDNGFSEPESYLKSKLEQFGCGRGDHDCFGRAIEKSFGVASEWRMNLSKADLMRSIDAGVPLVIGTEYKSAGHIVIVTGYNNDGVWINDPYGIRLGSANAYQTINPGYGRSEGKNDFYSWGTFRAVWGQDGEGWGRVVKSINGKNTGL